jgi:hypothetical protein
MDNHTNLFHWLLYIFYSNFSLFFIFFLCYDTIHNKIFDIFKNLKFQARLIERTPSMSDLNEVIFGQVRNHCRIQKTIMDSGCWWLSVLLASGYQWYLINQFFR